MLDAKVELESETLKAIVDAIYRSMASQMAQAEALHTGKPVKPGKFYAGLDKPNSPVDAISMIGFAAMRAAFVKDGAQVSE
jgi:hypothetical protein